MVDGCGPADCETQRSSSQPSGAGREPAGSPSPPPESSSAPDSPGDARDLVRLNEELEERVRDRTSFLEMLLETAEICNRTDSVPGALAAILELACRHFGWPVGHAYLAAPDAPGVYVDSGTWWLADPGKFAPIRERGTGLRFESGRGLIGKVAASARPRWVTDVRDDPIFAPGEPASLGTGAAFAFPIRVGQRVVGVVKLLSRDPQPPDPVLLEGMAQVGIQLGRVVERNELERKLAESVVQEHEAIGREIHDTLGQEIAGAGMLAQSLLQRVRSELPEEEEAVARLVAALAKARRGIRAVAKGLVPVAVDAEGLRSALADMVDAACGSFPIHCRFECEDPAPAESNLRANQLYRIAKEALHNAVRHSGATEVLVSLRSPGGRTVLEVIDDGRGIDPDAEGREGLGLRIMHHRADLMGGRLEIDSKPGSGTRVRCSLPREGHHA